MQNGGDRHVIVYLKLKMTNYGNYTWSFIVQAQLRAEADRLGCLSSTDVWTWDNQLHAYSIQSYSIFFVLYLLLFFVYKFCKFFCENLKTFLKLKKS